MKPIRLSKHAQQMIVARGAIESEVIEAIQTAPWMPAALGRLECRKDFTYGKQWNGRFYRTKQVRPIFAEETSEIIVVTVYVYYF
ncbi:MAG: DUF4258 domain-containing protein [Thermoguttaceae bacterium]|nr:DUF4258 domain-containing protein [Thermoguttaceae bacterium]MDW8039726.1 DUF4258 domain-containing protein [Thermoguttaceae bacterium]